MSTVRFISTASTQEICSQLPDPEYIVQVTKYTSDEFKAISNEISALHQQGVKLDKIFTRHFPTLPLNPTRSIVQDFKENIPLQKTIISEFLKSDEIYFENYFRAYFIDPLEKNIFPSPLQFDEIAETEFFKASREKGALEDSFKNLFHPLTLESSSCEVIRQLIVEKDKTRKALLISFLNSEYKSLNEYFNKNIIKSLKKTIDALVLDYYKKGISTQNAMNYFFKDSPIDLKSNPEAIKEFYNNPANRELISPSQNAFLRLFMLQAHSNQELGEFYKTYYRSYLKREKKHIVSQLDIIKDLRTAINESNMPVHVVYEEKLRSKVTNSVEYSSLLASPSTSSQEHKKAKMSFRRSSVRKFFDREVTSDLSKLVKKQICNELELGASSNSLFTVYFAQYKTLRKTQINDLLIKGTKLAPLVRNVLRLFLASSDDGLKEFFMDLVNKTRELHVAWEKIANDLIAVQVKNKIENDQIYTNLLGNFSKEMTHREAVEILIMPERECKLTNDHRIFLTVFMRSGYKTLGVFFDKYYVIASDEESIDTLIMQNIIQDREYKETYRNLLNGFKSKMTRREVETYLTNNVITSPSAAIILRHFLRSGEPTLGSYFKRRYDNVQFDYMVFDNVRFQLDLDDLHLALLPEVTPNMTVNNVEEYLNQHVEKLSPQSILYLTLFLQSGCDTIGAFLSARYENVIFKYSSDLARLLEDNKDNFFYKYEDEDSDAAFEAIQPSKLKKTMTKSDIIKLYSTHNTGVKTVQIHAVLHSFLSSRSCTLGEFFDTNCKPLELTRSSGMGLGLR